MTKERPILFSGAMVRAILDGRKTQTRRVVTGSGLGMLNDGFTPDYVALRENGYCRYAYAGDRLWARETWAQPAALDPGPCWGDRRPCGAAERLQRRTRSRKA
ncbi:hypothetical protein [Cupriavidus necator]|uniref:hypothetical protein n=1 Tax=Cupriavidus necator TaxID=106590 RepID=UPI0006907BD9|nr:hypothetical protein [Cupriavidus necator]